MASNSQLNVPPPPPIRIHQRGSVDVYLRLVSTMDVHSVPTPPVAAVTITRCLPPTESGKLGMTIEGLVSFLEQVYCLLFK